MLGSKHLPDGDNATYQLADVMLLTLVGMIAAVPARLPNSVRQLTIFVILTITESPDANKYIGY